MKPKKKSDNSLFETGCMILFGLPFLGGGLLFLVVGTMGLFKGESGSIGQMAFGAVFSMVGAFIMCIPVIGSKLGKKQEAIKKQFPDEPWKWNDRWKDGAVKAAGGGGAWVSLTVATLLIAVGAVMVYAIPWREELAKNKLVLLIFLFPLAGVMFLISSIYHMFRNMKYGQSELQLETFPGVIGGSFKGTVRIPAQVLPDNGFNVRIVCVEEYTSGSGKNRSTEERTLWEGERTVKDFTRRNRGLEVPVTFTIPSSCRQTTMERPGHDVIWRLTVSAETTGIDYKSTYEVPVFKTTDSKDGIEPDEVSVDKATSADTAGGKPDTIRDVCKGLGIDYSHPGRGRLSLRFKAFQNKKAAISTLAFFLVWTGIVVGLFMFGAPIIFGIFFGFFDIFLFLMVISLVFSSSIIEVNSREIRISKKILGIGGTKRIPLSAFQSIKPESSTQIGDKRIYHLTFKDKDGKEINGGGQIASKEKAMKIVYEIMDVVRENA